MIQSRAYMLLVSVFASIMLGSTVFVAERGRQLAAIAGAESALQQAAEAAGAEIPAATTDAPTAKAVAASAETIDSDSETLKKVALKVEQNGHPLEISAAVMRNLALNGGQAFKVKQLGYEREGVKRGFNVGTIEGKRVMLVSVQAPEGNWMFIVDHDGIIQKCLWAKKPQKELRQPNESDMKLMSEQVAYWRAKLPVLVASSSGAAGR